MPVDWSGVLRATESSVVRDALIAVDRGSAGLAVVIDDSSSLLGVVTDGDCRRHLLKGGTLDDSLEDVLNSKPLVVEASASRSAVLDLMQAYEIAVVPIVDEHNRLQGVHLLHQLIGKQSRENLCVILAGGFGTRLGAVSATTPKPMVQVAGRPILERLILHFMSYGVSRFVLAVGHLAEIIQEYFGSGERLGCSISYVRDPVGRPLGTAGPLTLIDPAHLNSASPVLVANGDLLTEANIGSLLSLHEQVSADATIGVHRYSHQIPFGVVNTREDGLVTSIDEKPDHHWQVSAGIYVLSNETITALPRESPLAMTELVQDLIAHGKRVAAFEVNEEWMDVGTPGDLQRARGR